MIRDTIFASLPDFSLIAKPHLFCSQCWNKNQTHGRTVFVLVVLQDKNTRRLNNHNTWLLEFMVQVTWLRRVLRNATRPPRYTFCLVILGEVPRCTTLASCTWIYKQATRRQGSIHKRTQFDVNWQWRLLFGLTTCRILNLVTSLHSEYIRPKSKKIRSK